MSNPEAARQAGTFMVVCDAPDPCRTGLDHRVVPYMITASLEQACSVSPNVTYQGRPVVLADQSCIAQVLGDEAGTGGGVRSGTRNGEVRFVEGARTVRVNGKHLVRVGDRVTMNNGNTTGVVIDLSGSAPRGPARADDVEGR